MISARRALERWAGIVACAVAAAGCAGGDDGKVAAVQAALDAKPITITVPNGKSCHRDTYWHDGAPHAFSGLPYVSVERAGTQSGIMGPEPCTTVTWAKSTNETPEVGNDEVGTLPVGHLVVEKVGDEQSLANGVKASPFTSHFEWFAIGKDMYARHLAQPVTQSPDERVELTKDATGAWVARLIIV